MKENIETGQTRFRRMTERDVYIMLGRKKQERWFRKLYPGFSSEEELGDFRRQEEERLAAGVDPLHVLTLLPQLHNRLRKAGVRTVDGVGEILDEHRRLSQIGPKREEDLRSQYEAYLGHKTRQES